MRRVLSSLIASSLLAALTAAEPLPLPIPPAAPVITSPATPTAVRRPLISGTTAAGTAVLVAIDGAAAEPAVVAGAGWSYAPGGDLPDGVHHYAVHAVAGGESSAVATQDRAVDATGPAVVIGAPSVALIGGGTATFLVTFSDVSGVEAITIATADASLVTTGTASATLTVGALTATTATVTLSAIDGDGTLAVALVAGTARDTLGNLAAAVPAGPPLVVDHTAPAVAITTTARVTADSTPTITGTAEAGATVTLYDGATLVGGATATTAGKWTITTSALAPGPHPLTAVAADPAGNVSAATAAVIITIDLGGPTVAVAAGGTGPGTATFTATFSSAVAGLSSAGVVVGGTAGGTLATLTLNTPRTQCTINVGGLSGPGTVTVQLLADAGTTAGGNPTGPSNLATLDYPSSGGDGTDAENAAGGGCGLGGGVGVVLLGALALVTFRRRVNPRA